MPTASDIITFIGIPLAVLGVLPILYTALNSLITLRKIQKSLHRNGLVGASCRGSLMSGVVEVSLPRFSITPLDREEDPEYWEVNPKPSNLKGGSWTILNWNCLVTGSRLYRLQYSSDLQIPQAEVDFEELLSFLLDRGAVPDVKGLHMLHVSGLWTPTGTSLLLSPDTMHSALRVALPNDSDGVISLALHWSKTWDNRDPSFLPPDWMRLRLPESEKKDSDQLLDKEGPETVDGTEKEHLAKQNPLAHRKMSIRFRLGHSGSSATISNAAWEQEGIPLTDPVTLDHLRSPPLSIWAPSIALALGLTRSLPLYNHNLDPSLSSFAARDTIPCGVLVMLGLLDEKDAPAWETKYDPHEFARRSHARFVAQNRAVQAERMMSPEQARIAGQARRAAELDQMGSEAMERMRTDRERRLKRKQEAIASPRLDPTAVSNAVLTWLIKEKLVDEGDDTQNAVEKVLAGIVTQEEHAIDACVVLEKWREWCNRGGMTIEDLEMLESKKLALCHAACIIGLLRDASSKEESAVALDMRECVQHWRKVRLG